MVEPFTAGVLSTLLPGRVYLKQASTSVARTIGASNKPSLSAHFFTPTARAVKRKANVVNCQVWDCREWACSVSRHSIWCPAATRSIMLEELSISQSQQPRCSGIRRTSQSTRDRLRHSSGRLSSELRANQRRHVSQSTSLSSDGLSNSPQSSMQIDLFRKSLKPSSLSMQASFDERLEVSLKKVEPLLAGLPEPELLELLCALADKLDEMLYPPKGNPLRIREWGKRLEELCQLIPSSPSEHSPRQALITRAEAMMGMLSPSIAYVNSVEKWDDEHFHAAGTVMLAVAFHQDVFRSLKFIIVENPFLSECAHRYIDNIIHILICRTPDILTLIPRAVKDKWIKVRKRNLGFHLLTAHRDPKILMDIITELREHNIAISRLLMLKTCRAFAVVKDFASAQKLYDSIPATEDRQYIQTGLYIAARRGNSPQAQKFFDGLKARGDLDAAAIANLLLLHAQRGRIREIHQVFDEYFPKNDQEQRLNEPNAYHYSIAMLAHAREGDFKGVTNWLEDMRRSGVQPNSYTFTSMIQALSRVNDLPALADVFSQMRKLGVKPDASSYTILIALFADRKDCESADSMYKLACEDGIIPDNRMTRSLMDAHVTSGSWKGATRIFDYLSSEPRTSRFLSLEVYNIIIKAHVLIGAPFRTVTRLFIKLKEMEFIPDKYSYSLLVMSACDSGQLRIATEIYYEMIREEKANQSVSLISAHVLTIIMAAFLRQGNKVRAKEIYDEMIEQGIQPTSVTYGTIIKAYGEEGTQESLQIAEDFIKRLVSVPKEERTWDKDDSKGKPALVKLYGPLLHANALKRNAGECERLYGEYLEAGGEPTIAMLTHILEAYRRSADIEGVLAIWPHIVDLATTAVFNADEPDKAFTTRPPGLQLPLSIYIDALSYAGLHSEITLVWRNLHKKGQRFDSHNWNHFAIALVRAGQVLPAFEVVDKVLLRYLEATGRDHDASAEERDKNPTSPISDPTDQGEVIAGVPLRHTLQTISQIRMHGTKQRVNAMERNANNMPVELLFEEAPDADFIHPLQSLQKIAPSWNVWRPHFSVLRTFLVAYLLLERGYVIRPVRRGELTRDNIGEVDFNQRDDAAAKDVLTNLRERCPDTVALIKDFQLGEQKRLGIVAFERMYSWR